MIRTTSSTSNLVAFTRSRHALAAIFAMAALGGCSAAEESNDDSSGGAATGTTTCAVGGDKKTTCTTHVICVNPNSDGKKEFDVDKKLTAAQINAACPQDTPSTPDADAVFDADKACPGTALTPAEIGPRLLPPGGSERALGSYTAKIRARTYNPASGHGAWTAAPDDTSFRASYTPQNRSGYTVLSSGSLAIIATAGGALSLNLNDPTGAIRLDEENSDYFVLSNYSGDDHVTPKVKITDKCLWIGGQTADREAAKLSGGVEYGFAIKIDLPKK